MEGGWRMLFLEDEREIIDLEFERLRFRPHLPFFFFPFFNTGSNDVYVRTTGIKHQCTKPINKI